MWVKSRQGAGLAPDLENPEMSSEMPETHWIQSEDDLLAVALALEEEAARRYRELADWARDRGSDDLAALFAALEAMEVEHGATVKSQNPRAPGRPIDPDRVRWKLPARFQDGELRSELLTPYRALSIAVRNEERAFAYYTYVAAQAHRQDIRALAEELARGELGHAALLRRERRRAFYAERPARESTPSTLAGLRAASVQWELAAKAADEPRALVRQLSRNVERYLRVAELATDEALLTEAQRLAEAALHRLTMARGPSSGPQPSSP